ncbi:MAG: hypothetical protein WBM58_11030 [Sedimenticolaceae bacterium]
MRDTNQALPSYLLIAAASLAQIAVAEHLKTPPCDELAAWSTSIDKQDRWEPFPENTRIWLPNAMASPEFEALFGKVALQWTQADVLSARGVWNGCIQKAKKARNKAQQTALSTARGYLTSNLRNAVRYGERREQNAQRMEQMQTQAPQQRQATTQTHAETAARAPQRSPKSATTSLDRAVNELVAQPASLESLRALGLLSRLDVHDSAALSQLERKLGAMPENPATKSAYQIVRDLRIRGTSVFDASALPKINARLAEVKPPVLDALREEFSQSPADPRRRRALAQRYETVMAELQAILSDDEWRSLADETRKKRLAIVASALVDAKSEIDKVPPGEKGIETINQIVKRTDARGLNIKQRKDLMDYAQARQRVLADELLRNAAETELPEIPENWAGIAALDELNSRLHRTVTGLASPQAAKDFVAALNARLAEVGRQALPEFEDQLAALPENEKGLAKAGERVAHVKAWHVMEESVRLDYLAEAEKRRDEIAVIVERNREERRSRVENERKKAIAAGADPRIVGYQWIDANDMMRLDFRDEETVFVTALGMKFAGTYKVSRDDIVVIGPHGQLVYSIRGETLVGNGAVFHKSGN